MEARRSMLFMAINNPRFLQGARRHNSDGVILDLEDAVGEPHKEYARTRPKETYAVVSVAGAKVQIRINHMPWWADLDGAVWPGVEQINYPKTEYGWEVQGLEAKMSALERRRGIRPGTIGLSAMCETIRGVTNAREIVIASPRIRSYGGGGLEGFDGCRDVAVEPSSTGERKSASQYGLGETALVALSAGLGGGGGVQVGTGVAGNVVSGDTAFDEAAANRRAGIYGGGVCLHPNRVDGLNQGYVPPQQEVEEAKRVVAFFEDLDARGEVDGDLNGKLVDKWDAERARKLLVWAGACERREREKAAARTRFEAETSAERSA